MDGSPLAARSRACALIAFAVFACVSTLALFSSLHVSAGRADETNPEAVPGQLVVGFDPDASDRQQQKVVDKAGGTITNSLDSINGAVVNVDPDKIDLAAAKLSRQRAVQYVEPNYIIHASKVPN